MLPVVLVLALIANSAFAQTVAEQVTNIAVGSIVEVQLQDKQKIRGYIGEASAGGFTLERIRNQASETVSIAYSEARSVKVVNSLTRDSATASAGKTTGKIALGILAGTGLVALVLMIIFAAGNN